jgi:hypothetical protein
MTASRLQFGWLIGIPGKSNLKKNKKKTGKSRLRKKHLFQFQEKGDEA